MQTDSRYEHIPAGTTQYNPRVWRNAYPAANWKNHRLWDQIRRGIPVRRDGGYECILRVTRAVGTQMIEPGSRSKWATFSEGEPPPSWVMAGTLRL